MSDSISLQAKFTTTRAELAASLIERDDEIDLVLTGLIAGENPLLVGPPGTAKSLLCDSLVAWVSGQQFSICLSKQTVPEEIFGPVSLSALKQDRYARVLTDRLPVADVAFIDEIFKASSTILNTMLKILNERTFVNDGKSIPCPLLIAIAASNEWPSDTDGGAELNALFDRFVLRKSVRTIATQDGLERLLWSDNLTPQLSTSITAAEIQRARAFAKRLPWQDAAKDAFMWILKDAKDDGIVPGDRRKRKAIGVAQAFAYLCGAGVVMPEHLEILSHVLWDDPAEQPQRLAEIVARIANPVGSMVNECLLQAEEILRDTDARNLTQATAACTKLGDITKRLADMPSQDARVQRAKKHVAKLVGDIKLKTVESFE